MLARRSTQRQTSSVRKRTWTHRRKSGREPSYFTTCKHCGVKIHLRQMEHDQWVAFDGKTRVHRCGQESEYDDLASAGGRRRNIRSFTVPKNEMQHPYHPTSAQAQPLPAQQPQSIRDLLCSPRKWPQLVAKLFFMIVSGIMEFITKSLILALRNWLIVWIFVVLILYFKK